MTALAFPLPEGYSWYRNGLLLAKEISNDVALIKKKVSLKENKVHLEQKYRNVSKNGSESFRIITKGPVLSINRAEKYDSGEYECEAYNSEGNSKATIVLNVLCE